jgi:regulator of PEP synthase PpsR (kinase-PPPase family)
VEVPVVVVPHVRRQSDLPAIVEEAVAARGIIVFTLVNANLAGQLAALAQARGVVAVDLMGDLLAHLSALLGQEPAGEPGLYRHQREAYFQRVEAIAFAVEHDDGQRIEELPQAEIVVIGPSRVGKTPLSIYLSVLGWRVANLPLVLEVPPPPVLFRVDRRRVVGLTIEPAQLLAHRQHRRRSLGIPLSAPYTDPTQVYEEVEAARRLYRRHNFAIVNATDKPIETSAEEVIALINRRLQTDAPGDTVPAADSPYR